MLRKQARRTNRKTVDVAEAVLASHLLLPSSTPAIEDDSDESSAHHAGSE